MPKPKRRKRRTKPKRGCRVLRCKRRVEAAELCATHLVREADRTFSLIIRARDGCRCRRCGSMDGVQCAHLVSRRYRILRWDERNAVTLCRAHHVYFTHRPLEHESFVDDTFGEGTWANLRREALAGGDWRSKAVAMVEAYR